MKELTAIEKMNYSYFMGIIKTIQQQIKSPNMMIYFSWGSHNFVAAQSKDEYPMPCLRFKVSGMKFKGYVHIFYNHADYYEIEFVTTHGNLKKRYDQVYADQLQEVIDEFVEKIPEYKD